MVLRPPEEAVLILVLLCGPQVTLAAWQEFDSQQEVVREFVNKARAAADRDLTFSSPESLGAELSQARVSGVLHFMCMALFMTLKLYIDLNITKYS